MAQNTYYPLLYELIIFPLCSFRPSSKRSGLTVSVSGPACLSRPFVHFLTDAAALDCGYGCGWGCGFGLCQGSQLANVSISCTLTVVRVVVAAVVVVVVVVAVASMKLLTTFVSCPDHTACSRRACVWVWVLSWSLSPSPSRLLPDFTSYWQWKPRLPQMPHFAALLWLIVDSWPHWQVSNKTLVLEISIWKFQRQGNKHFSLAFPLFAICDIFCNWFLPQKFCSFRFGPCVGFRALLWLFMVSVMALIYLCAFYRALSVPQTGAKSKNSFHFVARLITVWHSLEQSSRPLVRRLTCHRGTCTFLVYQKDV